MKLKHIIVTLFMILNITGCNKSEIDNINDLQGEIYKISALTSSSQTRVNINETVVKWDANDKIYIAEFGNDNKFTHIYTFTIVPNSISEDGKSADFLGPNLIEGREYMAFNGDVSLVSEGEYAGMIVKSGGQFRQEESDDLNVDWLMVSQSVIADNTVPQFIFTHQQSLIECNIKFSDDVSDDYKLQSIVIESPENSFSEYLYIDNKGEITTPDNSLSKSITLNIAGDPTVGMEKSYVAKIPVWWNPSITNIDGDFNITIHTSDNKQSTISYPAKKLISGHLYSANLTFPKPEQQNPIEICFADGDNSIRLEQISEALLTVVFPPNINKNDALNITADITPDESI